MNQPPAASPVEVAVEELRDRVALAALAEDGERLRAAVAAAGGPRGPFLAPAWFAVWAASLARDRLRLLVAHRAGRVVGILPLFAEQRRLWGLPARLLRSLSDEHSQRFDALVTPDERAAVAGAWVAHLRRDRSWDVVELRDVPDLDGAPAAGVAIAAAARAAGLPTGRWPSLRSPFIVLPPTAEALERSLDARFRGNLRRRARKLEAAAGPLALERVDGSAGRAAVDAALTDGWRMEAAGWKGARKTAIACDARLAARYRALALASAARGTLALYFLTAGGRRVAFHFGLVEDGVYYLFKPAFDPALSGFGPGHLLIERVARDLIARGIGELDLLGNDAPWKREWTDRVRVHAWHYLFASTVRGRALHAWKFRLAPLGRRLLPSR
jgi:CelD/BcsL family acetyltransferase involved in cellulose biosynthesis